MSCLLGDNLIVTILIWFIISFLLNNRNVVTWENLLSHENYEIRQLSTDLLLELTIYDDTNIQLLGELGKSESPEVVARTRWIVTEIFSRPRRLFRPERTTLGIEH